MRLPEVSGEVRALAVGRIAVGTAFVVAPGLFLRGWLRPAADGPVPRMLARSAGVRDVALGLGTLFALRHGSPVRGWLEAGMVADAGDAVALVLASRQLPSARPLAGVVTAVAAIAYGRGVVGRLPASGAAAP